ncbi:FAS1 domain containing protein [Parasponia andersonii]|uniref:FAS1 domain containing protein n=1 Tax=Parasponia andersonii TaxID=3476 RepID=A0A2P5CW84_PARAD|nr:FAS1 domain containing protein [Parasponia andersonii]
MAITFPSFALLISTILLCFSTTAIDGQQDQLPSFAPIPPLTSPQDLQNQQAFFSNIALLPQILSQLGYHELATAAPSLSTDSSPAAWIGPFTVFAPPEEALHSCLSCSVPSLLREHIVPGLFNIDYLRNLAFGTKIETLSSGRCITVTSEPSSPFESNETASFSKIFIGGLEITQPDLFNNGLVIVHGLQGFISPLSPLSCDVERMTTFTFNPDQNRGGLGGAAGQQRLHPFLQPVITRLMLREAMLRLRNNGFGILSLAMKVKYAELVNLSNMTIFALDDISIFSGSQSYISNVRFHIVPNIYLTFADLEKLPLGMPLPTLEQGQALVITTAGGGGSTTAPMRINYVRIKVPEVIRNLKIVVHGLFLPFPHIHPAAAVYDEILGGGGGSDMASARLVSDRLAGQGAAGTCYPLFGDGACVQAAMPPVKPTVEIEDHHGL